MSVTPNGEAVIAEPLVEENVPAAALHAAAHEFRRGMHLLVGRELSIAQLERVTTALAGLVDELESATPRERDGGAFADMTFVEAPADGEPFPDSGFRPVSGASNPFSVPMTTYRDGDSVVSTVVLGDAFEGAPGRSHGGFVSAIFDDLLGSLPMLTGKIAFTASLTVDYVAPSPVREPVTYRGWVDRVEGKKLFMTGEAHHGDTLVTKATALFIDATDIIVGRSAPAQ